VTHEFAVWAPRPERVELVLGRERLPMERDEHGWWRRTVADAGPGSRYGFSLDGGEPLADPRSRSQPDGITGLSEVVDPNAFSWRDGRWRGLALPGAVLYELHVGTFTEAGTFDAAVERLPHLVDLGIDAVELMPLAEFSGERGWGYDGVGLFAVHHACGGPDGLDRFVDACHAHGIGVVVDVVYNHLGPEGNHLPEFGPYLTDRHRTNWGDAVNMDGPGSDEVRRFLCDNARMWLRDHHVDGLRIDAVHAIVDDSATHILEELATEVDALAAQVRRPLFLIAESDRNDPAYVRNRDAGGMGLDAAWADEWHHALHAALTGERDGYYEDFGPLGLLAKALAQAWVYDGTWSPHRQRHHGASPAGLDGSQFVVSVQNHDQVGNRARGERLGAIACPSRLRVAAALLLTSPFVPMLFQGEEWGAASPFPYFADHADEDLRRAVRTGRQEEFAAFGWDPDELWDPYDHATFTAATLSWDEIGRAEHRGLLEWYRELIALRRREPALADPRLDPAHHRVDLDADTSTLVVHRGGLRVFVNLGDGSHRFASDAATDELLLASEPTVAIQDGMVTVPPDAVAIAAVRSAHASG
jgi:maltooligosyltrehalose trehalohydrolase